MTNPSALRKKFSTGCGKVCGKMDESLSNTPESLVPAKYFYFCHRVAGFENFGGKPREKAAKTSVFQGYRDDMIRIGCDKPMTNSMIHTTRTGFDPSRRR